MGIFTEDIATPDTQPVWDEASKRWITPGIDEPVGMKLKKVARPWLRNVASIASSAIAGGAQPNSVQFGGGDIMRAAEAGQEAPVAKALAESKLHNQQAQDALRGAQTFYTLTRPGMEATKETGRNERFSEGETGKNTRSAASVGEKANEAGLRAEGDAAKNQFNFDPMAAPGRRFTPRESSSLSPGQAAVNSLKAAQTGEANASAGLKNAQALSEQGKRELTKAQRDLAVERTKQLPLETKLKVQQLGVALGHLKNDNERTKVAKEQFNANYLGQLSDGTILLEDENGEPVGFKAAAIGKEPAAIMSTKAQSNTIIEEGDQLKKEVQRLGDQLGPFLGRENNIELMVGSANRDVSRLASRLKSFSAAQPKVHGFRGQNAADRFDQQVNIAKNPDGLQGAIDGILDFNKTLVGELGKVTKPKFNRPSSSNPKPPATTAPNAGPEPIGAKSGLPKSKALELLKGLPKDQQDRILAIDFPATK